jgi:thiol-disulfide isomerase/thioredoxin
MRAQNRYAASVQWGLRGGFYGLCPQTGRLSEKDPAMFSYLKKLTLAALFMTSAAHAAPSAPVAAPEFTGIENWINSEPLTLAGLRGKVVLVDFWTYTCINCVRTLPYVKSWHQKYKDQGLVVVGVHTPEFLFERSTSNVMTAVKHLGIDYPVAQDNRYKTWDAYRNTYWPAFYLIDKQGKIVYTHFGEGSYGQTDEVIQRLLAQPA